MYIYDSVVTLEKQEIEINDSYPKEVIILDIDEITGLLIPVCVRITSSIPVSNKGLKVDVAENGYIVTFEKRVQIVPLSGWDNDLRKTIDNFLNKDIETERKLTESELENDVLLVQLGKMSGEYQSLKDDSSV